MTPPILPQKRKMNMTSLRQLITDSLGTSVRMTIDDFREDQQGIIWFDVLVVTPGFSHLERERTCAYCGVAFISNAKTAKVCSTRCRVALHRSQASTEG